MPENGETLPVKNLKSLLQQSLGDDIEIKETTWKHLTDPGENFGSLILAIDVTVDQKKKKEILHVVTKLPPPSNYLMKLFDSPFSFSKEISFYRDLTPAFLELERELGIINPEETWIGARYLGSRLGLSDKFDDQACIVLENLNYSGYKMIDRLSGLNKNETEFAVRKLAQLHAMTIAMKKVKPGVFKDLIMPALSSVVNETAHQCVGDMVKKTLEHLESIPETRSYVEVVAKSMELAGKYESRQVKDDNWCTLTHNDFWVNNMMFKFDENNNQVVDMKMVDFQLYGYDYGVKDLIFLLISSPRNDIIEDIFDDMIKVYYEAFIDVLVKLNVDFSEFNRDKLINIVEECAPCKLAQCLMMTQVIKSQPGKAPKMECIDGKDSFLQIGGGKDHYDKLLLILNLFRRRNWLLADKN
ncbi:GSCOCG00013337001-RA-CDS [Cotesia congregata]|nr:GSCOCG00013337001-RA-CDS [Cotesia congregata]